MINVDKFYSELLKNQIEFFTGVPDSLLKSFCAYIKDNVDKRNNIIAANEGNAIALASGYHLATNKIGFVYMQNSGMGNSINPLVSLADELVYNIPMMLMIGWRGEPNTKDEPQHKKQGLITLDLLDVLNIKYKIIDDTMNDSDMASEIEDACSYIKSSNKRFAFVVKKGVFNKYVSKDKENNNFEMTREKALDIIISNIDKKSAIVSTTGMVSRELFELREKYEQSHEHDFLTVGSMGHASQIALGVALNTPEKNVYCIDGDGALIMHLGSLAIIGDLKPKNFRHILMNNGAHDSVGGQRTVGLKIDALNIAKSCGYDYLYSCSTEEELKKYINEIKDIKGTVFLEVKVNKGARPDLGRPNKSPIENKRAFMEFLAEK